MTTPNPAFDLAAALAGLVTFPDPPGGSLTLVQPPTAGANLYRGPMREQDTQMSARAVFVQTGAGVPLEPYLGGAQDWAKPTAIAYVRSAVDDFDGGEALARGVLRKLHRATVSGYVYVLALSSEPIYLGQDDRGLHRWSITFECGHVR